MQLSVYLFVNWGYASAHPIATRLLELVATHPQLKLGGCVVEGVQSHVRQSAQHAMRVLSHTVAASAAKGERADIHRLQRDTPWPRNLHDVVPRSLQLTMQDISSSTQADAQENGEGSSVLMSVFWTRKFDDALLGCFTQAVNYHNGAVPDFRGLRATSWSIYRERAISGFTFHRIDDGFDTGPILAEGTVPILQADVRARVEMAKSQAAAACLPEVLEAIVQQREGRTQTHKDRYLSSSEVRALCFISNAQDIELAEVNLRIRSFGAVRIERPGGQSLLLTRPLTPGSPGMLRRAVEFADQPGQPSLLDAMRHVQWQIRNIKPRKRNNP